MLRYSVTLQCTIGVRVQYQLQQAEHQRGAVSDAVVGPAAQLHESMETLRLLTPTRNKVLHFRREDEWSPVPTITERRGQG